MPTNGQERKDVRAVLELLDVPTEPPRFREQGLLALGGVVGVVLSVPVLGAGGAWGLLVGWAVLLLGGAMLVVAGMSFSYWRQLRALVVKALRGGLSVHETALTIGGVPSLRGLRFEGWLAHAQRRVEQALASLVRDAIRRGSAANNEASHADEWSHQARRADRFLVAMTDLREVTRPGPLRDRIDDVIAQAQTVRVDIHRLTVVGAAAGSNAAAQDAAARVDELLDSLRVALDSATGSLVAAERSDGIDTAATLQDTATALLRAHQDVADEQAGGPPASSRSTGHTEANTSTDEAEPRSQPG